MARFLASVSSILSWITLASGAGYMLLIIWEILRPRVADTTLVAAGVLFPITLIVTPVYAVMQLGDWRLAIAFALTITFTGLLRLARRNFDRAA